tara:strand:+ start:39 stop:266 length:228 start_codon:yes stop_codon:yes gene_type:complete
MKPKNSLNFMNAFLMLSDLANDNIKDKVRSKERIVFATMKANIPQWQPPKDWDTLTDKEKLKRLENIQKMNNNSV